jgi:hypothetical protein
MAPDMPANERRHALLIEPSGLGALILQRPGRDQLGRVWCGSIAHAIYKLLLTDAMMSRNQR